MKEKSSFVTEPIIRGIHGNGKSFVRNEWGNG